MSHLVFGKIKINISQELHLFLTISCVLIQSLFITTGKHVVVQCTSRVVNKETVNLVLSNFRKLEALACRYAD